jgi:hypothetical protein
LHRASDQFCAHRALRTASATASESA